MDSQAQVGLSGGRAFAKSVNEKKLMMALYRRRNGGSDGIYSDLVYSGVPVRRFHFRSFPYQGGVYYSRIPSGGPCT